LLDLPYWQEKTKVKTFVVDQVERPTPN